MKKLDPVKDGRSPDVTEANIEALERLFPAIVTDGKIDFDALRAELGEEVDESSERYGLSWAGKAQARRLAQTPSAATLRPVPEGSVEWDTTKNIFIEGDNLEVLKLLQKSYHRKVKLIYIDPPYNTGNDFIYPDDYKDNLATYLRYTGQVDEEGFKTSTNSETSGRYHTKWLNMMYPRLRLARSLLADDGLLVATIDDTELANLLHLCFEVFGEENHVATAAWQKAYVANMTARHISSTHDHVVMFARDIHILSMGRNPRTAAQLAKFSNPDSDPRGPWKAENLSSGKFYSAGQFEIVTPAGNSVMPPPGRYWRCSQERYQEWVDEGRIWFGASGEGRPMLKKYLAEVEEGLTPDTWWNHKDYGSNKQATTELKTLFDGNQVFDTPKPVRLMERLLTLGKTEGRIVLDFFAGSGALGEASLNLSARGEGPERFILVQLPEPHDPDSRASQLGLATIADTAKDRLRRVIRQLNAPAGDAGQASMSLSVGPALGFRSFALAASNFKTWDPDIESLEEDLLAAVDHIKPDRSEEDVLFEILLKYGLDLSLPIEVRDVGADGHAHVVGHGALIACLHKGIDDAVVQGIVKLYEELTPEVCRVVFLDSGFVDDVVKANAVETLRLAGITDVRSV